MNAAFTNWRVPGYLGSAAYRIRPISPAIFDSMMNMRLKLRTRQGVALTARLRDVNGPAEVFGGAEYTHDWIDWTRIEYVIDLGAHVGSFAIWAATHARCRVASFEPNPDVRRLLQLNVDRLGLASRVAVHPEAVASQRGTRRFLPAQDSAASGLSDSGALEVETIPLSEAISLSGFPRVDLVKVDIEGAEFEVFRAPEPSALASVAFWIVECHLGNGLDAGPIAALFEREGFEVARMPKTPLLELLVARRAQADLAG